MNSNYFKLALERLSSADWIDFEKLSSAFLASDYPELRTMASPSGDGGRDSELFSPTGVASVVCQYSVSEDWRNKIRHTVKRIKDTNPDADSLIYMTNQIIGAQGDELRKELREKRIWLDIRDQNWFLERLNIDNNKYQAACELSDRYARPYLEDLKVIEKKRPSLSNQEAKAALVYLEMQWEDNNTEKGLTKLAFESLVRAALRATNDNNRLSRGEVYNRISSYLPSAELTKIKTHIDSALKKLDKKCVTHRQKEDEFHLRYDESERLRQRLADKECEENKFDVIIKDCVNFALGKENCSEPNKVDIVNRTKRILDAFLLRSGELFATSVVSGEVHKIDRELLKTVIHSDNSTHPPLHSKGFLPDLLEKTIENLLHSSNDVVKKHLRILSDSYTLFAFLRETPDVKSATKKIFSHGSIWLDTTVVLPLISETLKDPSDRPFTNIVNTLRRSDVELFVTDGVVREILNHLRISESCSERKISEWRGRVPYVFNHYMELGYSREQFKSWTVNIRGRERPDDDISEYLEETFGIRVSPLSEFAKTVDEAIRFCVERLWSETHKTRRSAHDGIEQDEQITSLLVKHDVESYLGVIALRQKESKSELGYKHWWLTIDGDAWKIRDAIRDELKDKTPASPLISLDFLANNLAFGSMRSHIDRSTEQMLPIMLDLDFGEGIPREIIEIAEKVRDDNKFSSESLIRRKTRDACDKAKRTSGKLTKQAINSENGMQ